MSKITIVAAVAAAYATIAATSFALGFLLAPAKAQTGEAAISHREAPPADGRNARMPLPAIAGSARIGSGVRTKMLS
jgi:hypothetical protein